MIDSFLPRLFLVTAVMGGLVVTSGALIVSGRRSWSDWVMVAGAGLATQGLFMTTLVAFDLSDWLQKHGEYPCLGSICLGTMFFAVGFVVNQLRDRALARYEHQVRQIKQARAPGPPEQPPRHG